MLNLQKNYLEKYQQIYPENTEWNSIEYKLQLNLGNASIELKKVYCVVNPYLSNQFEKQNKGHIISDVYIKPENLVGSNRIQRVCQKGFQFTGPNGSNGLIFNIGQIQDIDPQQKIQHELLVVKIAPRKTYPTLANQESLSDEFKIPDGFDSLYYRQPEEDTEIYRHRFKIYRKMQTLPYYLIQFSFNNNHQQKFKKIVCQSCQDVIATHYCITEKVYFCKKCDYQHHKDKISSKHQRKPLTEKPILNFGYCNSHKQNKNELFCRECNLSMCMSCKIYGTHSEGPMASHQLQKISDYFEQIATKINEMDPNLQKRKDQFEQILAILDSKINEINSTTQSIQASLTSIFQQSLRDLQMISRRKLSYLVADQLQTRRQYDYIQWMESFLKYQFNVLPPDAFLKSWTKHLKLRKEVLNIANIPAISEIKPNYRIYGRIKVMDDGEAALHQNLSDFDDLTTKKKSNDISTNQKKQMMETLTVTQSNNEQQQTLFRKKLFPVPET